MNQKQIGNKNYIIDESLKELANKIIKKEPLWFDPEVDNVKLGYMLVYPHISKTTAGKCIKSSDELKYFSSYDYVIQMSGELWDVLGDDEKYILMQHELMHVFVTYDKKGDIQYKIRQHDFEDFRIIIEKNGMDWLKVINASTETLYDLEPDPTRKIKL